MIKGITYALSACFIWGLIFIVPQFMEGFSSFEVALGRFAFFGIASLLIFFKSRLGGSCRYPLPIWLKALYFSLICSFGYYPFVVLALRYSTPAICALILGISPITIAFYGNWKEKECSFKSLILPSVLILVGLIIINAPHLLDNPSPKTFILGLVCALVALASWSWYVVANSRFLKSNPTVQSSDWSTLIGVGSFIWVIFFTAVIALFFNDQIELQKYITPNATLVNYLIGCAILGLICSWVGAFLWNRASLYLPVSLAGQLTIFETIFGIIFVYTLDQHLPPLLECIGIVFLLAAIVYGIRQATKNVPEITH